MDHPDLYGLLERDREARAYFEELPRYVQAQLGLQAGGVHSLAGLKDYAESLLRGRL